MLIKPGVWRTFVGVLFATLFMLFLMDGFVELVSMGLHLDFLGSEIFGDFPSDLVLKPRVTLSSSCSCSVPSQSQAGIPSQVVLYAPKGVRMPWTSLLPRGKMDLVRTDRTRDVRVFPAAALAPEQRRLADVLARDAVAAASTPKKLQARHIVPLKSEVMERQLKELTHALGTPVPSQVSQPSKSTGRVVLARPTATLTRSSSIQVAGASRS